VIFSRCSQGLSDNTSYLEEGADDLNADRLSLHLLGIVDVRRFVVKSTLRDRCACFNDVRKGKGSSVTQRQRTVDASLTPAIGQLVLFRVDKRHRHDADTRVDDIVDHCGDRHHGEVPGLADARRGGGLNRTDDGVEFELAPYLFLEERFVRCAAQPSPFQCQLATSVAWVREGTMTHRR
jgi:hypothetical protein